MRLANRQESQTLDEKAQTEFGLRSENLMESAGSAVAEEIHTQIKLSLIHI